LSKNTETKNPVQSYVPGGIFLTYRLLVQYTIEESELDEKAIVSKMEITTKKGSPLAGLSNRKENI